MKMACNVHKGFQTLFAINMSADLCSCVHVSQFICFL